jgi:hypothetical protein
MFNIQPGFLGGVAATPETLWFYDTFTAKNYGKLANHAPEVGYGWSVDATNGIGTIESIILVNGAARKPTSDEDADNFSGASYYNSSADPIQSSTYFIEAKFTFAGFQGDVGYAIFGLQSPVGTADHAYSVEIDNSSSISFSAPGNSTSYSSFSVSPGVEHTLRIEIDGQTVTVKLDGTTKFISYASLPLEQALTMYQFGTNGLEAFSVNSIKIAS